MGVILVMTNQCLMLFGLFLDQATAVDNTLAQSQLYQGMAAFFFILCGIYLLFSILLGVFKDVIIEPGESFLHKCFFGLYYVLPNFFSLLLFHNTMITEDDMLDVMAGQATGTVAGRSSVRQDDADFDDMPPINL